MLFDSPCLLFSDLPRSESEVAIAMGIVIDFSLGCLRVKKIIIKIKASPCISRCPPLLSSLCRKQVASPLQVEGNPGIGMKQSFALSVRGKEPPISLHLSGHRRKKIGDVSIQEGERGTEERQDGQSDAGSQGGEGRRRQDPSKRLKRRE